MIIQDISADQLLYAVLKQVTLVLRKKVHFQPANIATFYAQSSTFVRILWTFG